MIGVLLGTALSVFCEEYKALLPSKERIEEIRRDFEKFKSRKIQIDTGNLLPSEEKIREVKERYKHLGEYSGEEIEGLRDALLTSAGQQRVWKIFFSTPPPSEENSKKETIFYLFSRSVPRATVDNVFRWAKNLKDWKFYGVIRGIDKEILSYITSLKNFRHITIKVNPLIFEKVGAEVVPAFVFAECKMIMGVLRTGDCEFKAVLYGDVSLKWALEKYKGEVR
ncbi:MAG TPA: hypothetical protein EYP20_04100 [Aigarchaeota archaeon]|nr:hypothetical protein [Aigarchaeota archaeon]